MRSGDNVRGTVGVAGCCSARVERIAGESRARDRERQGEPEAYWRSVKHESGKEREREKLEAGARIDSRVAFITVK